MQLILDQVVTRRGDFSVVASGTFVPGLHLLTGRVGSGKSTLAELISGVRTPESGRVSRDSIRSVLLSMQFPEYHLTTASVGSEIASWGHDPKVILGQTGLCGREPDDILTLSRGELKKLHLSCILARTYDLIILDEPFAGLDQKARRWARDLISRYTDRIVIIISHDITCLPRIDQIWEMNHGNLSHRGMLPEALIGWDEAPPLIRYLAAQGVVPDGISQEDIERAVCRIHE
ncbi:MAG TPA: ATP-binding cassette domain-containing protein [Methanospirillum sp.]|nr:ATP-binding cassette domain-containing protein [Methanospirillum sp.]